MALPPHQINLILRVGLDPFDPKFETEEPIEYVLGKSDFREHLFNVNKNVLIPRIETEEIIDIGLKYLEVNQLLVKGSTVTFADVATGSGAIGISCAWELQKLGIGFNGYLSDISKDALEVAKSNVENIFDKGLDGSSLTILESDLMNSFPKDLKFQIIFANLPYIPSSRIKDLQKSVKEYEPSLALDGGEDGLSYILRLINEAREWLDTNGVLVLEVDDSHDMSIVNSSEFKSKLGIKNGVEAKITVLEDMFGKNRFWIVTY